MCGGAVKRAALALLLAGCVPQPGPVVAGGDAGDGCGPQAVVFVQAGDVLGEPPRRTGPAPAEQLAAELMRENVAIERLQIAFDALLYCRWTEVRLIRAAASAGDFPRGELPGRLAAASGRLQRDLGRGGQARVRLQARAARIDAAVEAVAPGATRIGGPGGGPGGVPGATRAVASAPLVLRQRPDGAAGEAGRLLAGAEAYLRPAAGGFVLAEVGGVSGYAPASAFTVLPALARPGGGDALRSLAATNISRREVFFQSLALAERSGTQGFEPGS